MSGNLSLTNILVGLFLVYVSYSFYTIWQLFSLSECTSNCLLPAWEPYDFLKLDLVVSTKKQLNSYGDFSPFFSIDNLTRGGDGAEFLRTLNISIPLKTRNNGSLFVHAFLAAASGPNNPLTDDESFYARSLLTQYHQLPPAALNLMSGNFSSIQVSGRKRDERPVAHLRTRLVLHVLDPSTVFDRFAVPPDIHPMVRLDRTNARYLPILYIDPLSFRTRDLVALNSSTKQLPITVSLSTISVGKLRFWTAMEQALGQMRSLGFGEKELDDIRGIFTDTSLSFLMLTMVVSMFHLLFDCLAFKNDISFWRAREDVAGISLRGVVWRALSTAIIFLYLLDEETSYLVLVPAGVGAVIEAMRYLSWLLYPLVLAGAVYSLLYTPHKSWYSWLIKTLVNGVYCFGFLFMLPQLFLNYKLKSVAHLPLKAFMYKAFNTFIDDIFAFIITMPTAHRLACFRDDLVFLVYLYQRWLYPIDMTRVNEYGQSFTEEGAAVSGRRPKTE